MSEQAVDIDKFLKRVRKQREAANATAQQIEFDLVRFNGENASIDFNVDWSHETVWGTQQQIADAFGVERSVVTKHIGNIYDAGELDREATCAKFALHRLEGGRQVQREVDHFNLDVILSVGYRVSSVKATEFRKWATQTLRSYIVDGFALNESRLRNDPNALRDLAARVRALRTEEITIYEAVRDCFKVASSDYDKTSPKVRSFYSKLQDKFLFAITGKTASQLILARADGAKDNMGVTASKGVVPTKKEAIVGKNYLLSDELYVLHILCEQFLLYAESKAIRGQSMTMDELAEKLDRLLATNDYPVFEGYRDYLKKQAVDHAEREWARFMVAVGRGKRIPPPKTAPTLPFDDQKGIFDDIWALEEAYERKQAMGVASALGIPLAELEGQQWALEPDVGNDGIIYSYLVILESGETRTVMPWDVE